MNMMKSDDENLMLADSPESVDNLNAQFYSRFPYPWRPLKFDRLVDPYFETIMLNQDLGDWQHRTIPKTPKIWVAGCGTNQAVFTALKFPKATVLGSDLSETSLEIATQTAKELGLANLQLKQESLNQVTYHEQFDYIICTGVIHHNANPQATLTRLASALKPRGILELMVYNRFHRIANSTFQKAVRILLKENTSSVNFESELPIAMKLVNGGFSTNSLMASFLSEYRDGSEAKLADALIQPIEHSYTVESLEELVTGCGLELVAPRINLFDTARNAFSWTMDFTDPELQELYHSLPDSRRWHVTNLLRLEDSPMLWFYVQRQDSDRANKSEPEICEEFLQQRFIKTQTMQQSYILNYEALYQLSSKSVPFPVATSDPLSRKFLAEIDGKRSIAEIFESLGINTNFQSVNEMRLKLTTSAFPYLKAVQPEAESLEDKNLAAVSLTKLKRIQQSRIITR
jgi:SAM-dependent methyltransferase